MKPDLFVLQLEVRPANGSLWSTATFGPFETDDEAAEWAEKCSMDVAWFHKIGLRMPLS